MVLDGYFVPKIAVLNFMVAERGWDPKVWEDLMEFKPEIFLRNVDDDDGGGVEVFDIIGSKEIRMMPFGAGRRMRLVWFSNVSFGVFCSQSCVKI